MSDESRKNYEQAVSNIASLACIAYFVAGMVGLCVSQFYSDSLKTQALVALGSGAGGFIVTALVFVWLYLRDAP